MSIVPPQKLKIQLLLTPSLLFFLGLISCASSPQSFNAQTSIQIDWVNVIEFGRITYNGNLAHAGRPLSGSDLGPMFATVKFKLDGNVHDPGYQLKDGDAAFLDAGTIVYTVKGYTASFRLAAYENKSLMLFEADTNPGAKKGADLLDIGGKVQYIGINSEQDGSTQLASIKDSQQVATLDAMVLEAPVDQNALRQEGPRYFLTFYLKDGTAVTRSYWLHSGELARGILLPETFSLAVKHALQP